MKEDNPEEIEIYTIKDSKDGNANNSNETSKNSINKFHFDFKHDSLKTNLKGYILYLIRDPDSSNFISFVNSILQIYLFFAIMTFCLQTVPELKNTKAKEEFWLVSETIFNIVFTVEYLVRLITYPFREKNIGKTKIIMALRFMKKPMNVIDVISLLPFYMETFFPEVLSGYGNTLTLIIRSFKLFRLFRMFSHSSKFSLQIQIVSQAFIQSKDGIIILIWAFGLAIIIFSTGFYIAETSQCTYNKDEMFWYVKGSTTEPCTVQSIIGAFWWACVTIATVGYGDIVPHTIPGKILSGVTMTCALLISSIPVTILSYNLSNIYSTYQDKKDVFKREGSKKKLNILKLLTEKTKEEKLDEDASPKSIIKKEEIQQMFIDELVKNRSFASFISNPKIHSDITEKNIVESPTDDLTDNTLNTNSTAKDSLVKESPKNNTILLSEKVLKAMRNPVTENVSGNVPENLNHVSEPEDSHPTNNSLYNFTLKQYQENMIEIQNLMNKLTKLKNLNNEYEVVLKSFDKKNI